MGLNINNKKNSKTQKKIFTKKTISVILLHRVSIVFFPGAKILFILRQNVF